MKRYNVSFEKNGVYQSNLVETDKSPVEIGLYFRDVKKASHVFGVDFATRDDERPGKPVLKI
ncbi:MAG: hypothetical protein IJ896_15220 [Fibrobacter sp.]|nr:hypothetical protein [Fibrobacter sp.]